MSREHYATRAIWRTGTVTVDGLGPSPKALSIDQLVTKCLCEGHNSQLSSIDNAGWDLVNVLRAVQDAAAPKVAYVLDGYFVERWLMKTAIGFAHVDGRWSGDDHAARFVFGQAQLPDGAGMAAVQRPGDRLVDRDRIGVHFDGRPPTQAMVILRGGYRFLMVWNRSVADLRGVVVGGVDVYGRESIVPRPKRIAAGRRAIMFSWSGAKQQYAPTARVLRLRDRYQPPPR